MPRPAVAPETVARARELMEELGSYGQVSRAMGVSHTTITRWLGPSPNKGRAIREERWTVADEMYRAGASHRAIQRATNISRWALVNRYGKSNYDRAQSLKKARQTRDRIRREQFERRYRIAVRLRVDKGMTNREISDATGIPMHFIQRHLGGTPKRLGGKRQWDPGMHERVRFLHELEWSYAEIEKETGVPTSTISDWINGRCSG